MCAGSALDRSDRFECWFPVSKYKTGLTGLSDRLVADNWLSVLICRTPFSRRHCAIKIISIGIRATVSGLKLNRLENRDVDTM